MPMTSTASVISLPVIFRLATARGPLRPLRLLQPGGVEVRRELDLELERQAAFLGALEADPLDDQEALRALELGDEVTQVGVIPLDGDADRELLETVLVDLPVVVADRPRVDAVLGSDVHDLALDRDQLLLLRAEHLVVEVADVLLRALELLVEARQRLLRALGVGELLLEGRARSLQVARRDDARTDEEPVHGGVHEQERAPDEDDGLHVAPDVEGPHCVSPGSPPVPPAAGTVGTSGSGGGGGLSPRDPG